MQDIIFIFQWFAVFLLIGLVFTPLTFFLFNNFFDRGYIFSKTIGIIFISYLAFLLSTTKIFSFNLSIVLAIIISLAINYLVSRKVGIRKLFQGKVFIFILEEVLFLSCLSFWSYVRGNQPDIHGLEKFMDFGFVNSILRADYLPPKDIWFTPFSINYYYFGHLITAVLTKISAIPSYITFNLMISTLFALSFVSSFSIGATLLKPFAKKIKLYWLFGLMTAFFVTLAGNIHAIYTLFKPYQNESPVPFWQLLFSPSTFSNSYWYPNATRFINHTIHEFPIYSWVVADLHGHVLDIPIVLLTIAVILSVLLKKESKLFNSILIGFLLAVMYMTNAWDGIIYFLLALIVFFVLFLKLKDKKLSFSFFGFIKPTVIILVSYFVFSFPFSLSFKPFVSGIGVLCAPKSLVAIGKIGPFLFEADHCQLSPLWQLLILYGFFYFLVISFILVLRKTRKINREDLFVVILIILSTVLIILPEIVYIKDIYPTYYRANTMFKLVYQSFIMLSISCGYIMIRIFSLFKKSKINKFVSYKINLYVFFPWSIILLFLLFLIVVYPFLAIPSYYNNLQKYVGLNGTTYLKTLYTTDYAAIEWLNKNIKEQPIILEAQGDSYTDYARVSSNTGLPTVLGWTVHEWLWRGSYDIPAPRIKDVENLYQSKDLSLVKSLIKKYNISLVFIGDLEKEKYKNINETNFKKLGEIIYKNGSTKIYKIRGV
ncbi:MAG: hypothetical protein A2152_03950 [Candidatus Levybacteria bacterium RBG_16_35_6]|nr:MAG: hypothetical protein A2152_03950 [Candidatus Levybacteria bacterium RBG_16_35_6]